MLKKALLPVYEPDRRKLRDYVTKPGCGQGVPKKNIQLKEGEKARPDQLRAPMMTPAEFAKKPMAFIHKYCRHYTPSPAEQERKLREIPVELAGLKDPSSPGQLLFREGGPVLKALEQLIVLVRAGKLQGERTMRANGSAWQCCVGVRLV